MTDTEGYALVAHDPGIEDHKALAEDVGADELLADGDAADLHWLYYDGDATRIYTYRTERGTWFIHDILNLTAIPQEAATKDLALTGLVQYWKDES